jgi:hypothetical protein
MAALYKAALANSIGVQADQRRWLAQRNQCSGDANKISSCVYDSYRARFAAIAATYDLMHLTGHYEDKNRNGSMDAVLFPDHRLWAQISSDNGPPAYNSCGVTLEAPFIEGKLHYVDPPSPANDHANAEHCSIDIAIKGNMFIVTQTGCDLYCGHNAFFDGQYKRMP